ncbi:hypothetical protein IAD21_03790 [Abditibacteriota bacterium]|nr:hypothetical protein IAD21_03790 [Abditibacteriota bacterium]
MLHRTLTFSYLTYLSSGTQITYPSFLVGTPLFLSEDTLRLSVDKGRLFVCHYLCPSLI